MKKRKHKKQLQKYSSHKLNEVQVGTSLDMAEVPNPGPQLIVHWTTLGWEFKGQRRK